MNLVARTEMIQSFERELQLKKDSMMDCLESLCKIKESGALSRSDISELQRRGAEYFNFAEDSVAKTALLEADHVGEWVTKFAEDCHEVLATLVVYRDALQSLAMDVGFNIQPLGATSYAAMQRVTKKYLAKDVWRKLEGDMNEAGLPTSGFRRKAVKDKSSRSNVAYVVISLTGIVAIFVATILLPEPTRFQWFVFKAIISISIGALAVYIKGFLGIHISQKTLDSNLVISAGGALAVFVLLLLFDP